MTQPRRPLIRPSHLALLATLLAFMVVTLGAYTRLSHAGLSCPDWPGCYGFLTVPNSEHEMALAAERYPEAPVEHHKGWLEMTHRYAAGLLGVLVLTLGWLAWRHREESDYPKDISWALLWVVAVQALFGMLTVTLKLWPQVVTLHLLGGFASLALLFWLWLGLRRWETIDYRAPGRQQQAESKRLKIVVNVALLVVVLQVALGGWTSANYAAYACPDFPTCHGEWWPEMSLAEGFNVGQVVGPNYLGGQLEGPGRVAIHAVHRLGALVVSLMVLLLAIALWRYRRPEASMLLVGALCLQLLIGIANVVWHFPLELALAHNTGAALLLLSLVWLRFTLQAVPVRWVESVSITVREICYEKSSSSYS